MRQTSRGWWLAFPAALLAVGLTAACGQRQLRSWTHQRLVRRCQEQIAATPDRRAARLVLQLAESDDQWLEAIVAAWADPRRPVSRAGQVATLGLADRWSRLPAAEGSQRLAALARLLAQHAPQMDDPSRDTASSLAQRLLDLPIDNRHVSAARFVADCESVLRLPSSAADEVRLAALPVARPVVPPPAPPMELPPAPAPALQPLQTPAALMPAPSPIARPALLPDSNRQPLAEPQPLPAPKAKAKAIKISDDE